MSSWFYLILAGIFEIGWPVGLKLASVPNYKFLGFFLSIIAMTISGLLLWVSLKEIHIGIAYAVWTGIGAVGTFVIGVIFFNDPNSILKWLGVVAIVSGIVLLKI